MKEINEELEISNNIEDKEKEYKWVEINQEEIN